MLKQAQKAGKVAADFRLPADWCDNTPEAVQAALAAGGDADVFPAFPFGRDFTDEELTLGKALKTLKAATATRRGKLWTLLQAARARDHENRYASLLERMGLAQPSGLRAKLDQRLVIYGLQLNDTPTDTGNPET